MTSGIRSLRGGARSILRASTAVLLAGLVSGPAPASAQDMSSSGTTLRRGRRS